MTKIGPWNATINALPAVYMYAKVKCSAGKGFRERGVELSSLVTHYYEPTVLHYILAVVITTARYIHVHEKAFCKGNYNATRLMATASCFIINHLGWTDKYGVLISVRLTSKVGQELPPSANNAFSGSE